MSYKILVSLIVFGICSIGFGLKFKTLKIPNGLSRNAGNRDKAFHMMDRMLSSKLIKTPLDFITRNKTIWPNKTATKLLEQSEAGIGLQQLYIIKLICAIMCTFLLFIIRFSNVNFETKLIIGSSDNDSSILFQQSSYDDSKYKLYNQVLSKVGKNNLENANDTEKYELIQEKMSECLNTTEPQLIEDNTNWFIEKWIKVQNIKVLKYRYLLIILGSFFLPELLIILIWLLKGCVYKKEIIKLEYIFELLARVDGIKTLDIIYELKKSSKIYSKYLDEFIKIFRYDKIRGFEYLKSKNIKSLAKLSEVLEIYSLSDKEIALQILERGVIERDEAMMMTADETVDFIDVVAFLSIVPLIYEIVMLMLRPMLDVIYKAFEFI